MKTLTDLLARNRAWANDRVAADPDFFKRLTGIQRPNFLWIGCSDSRVPANQIAGMDPGEMFVQRNIANIVAPGDSNCMAVVQYAITTLGVRHAIVCGHYGCGGVRAVIDDEFGGAAHVERWLAPLRHLASQHAPDLSKYPTHDDKWDRLCEINVIEQVQRLQNSDVLTESKLRGVPVTVYGLIYSLRDGLLRHLTPAVNLPR